MTQGFLESAMKEAWERTQPKVREAIDTILRQWKWYDRGWAWYEKQIKVIFS